MQIGQIRVLSFSFGIKGTVSMGLRAKGFERMVSSLELLQNRAQPQQCIALTSLIQPTGHI